MKTARASFILTEQCNTEEQWTARDRNYSQEFSCATLQEVQNKILERIEVFKGYYTITDKFTCSILSLNINDLISMSNGGKLVYEGEGWNGEDGMDATTCQLYYYLRPMREQN